jgi:uncharacterized protein YlxW (UPF0749 family)
MVPMTRSDSAPPAVDASMRLLREVMEQPLDPAYERAARSRARGERPGGGALVLTLVIALVCGWAVTQGVGELRRPEPAEAGGRATLEREIARRTAVADAEQRRIQSLRTRIAEAQNSRLTSSGDTRLAAQGQQLALLTGELPVRGPGLEISLQDAPRADASGAVVDPRADSGDDGRVHDRDVQIVVNGLWAAGAEAVAVNGRRLTSLSAIRSAGEAILVDFRPLLPPYRVQAIGNAQELLRQFTPQFAGSYLQSLRDNYGIGVSITSVQSLDLPAAGAFELHQARVSAPVSPPTGGPLPTAPTTSSTGATSTSSSTEVTP